MSLIKPTGTTAKSALALTGGAVVGGFGSRAVMGLIHNPPATQDTTTQKKNENTRMVKHILLGAVGIALAAAVKGTSTSIQLVQGAGAGIALEQTFEVAKIIANRRGVPNEQNAGSKTAKMTAKVLGLGSPGCGCNAHQLNGRGLREPFTPNYDAPAFDTIAVDGGSDIFFGNPVAMAAARAGMI